MFTKTSFLHNRYWESARHWHAKSEPFASGEQLQQALFNGWQLDKIAFRTEHPLKTSGRLIVFYVVMLVKDGEKQHMPVLVNPFVERLIAEKNVQLIRVERHHTRTVQPEPDPEMTQESSAVVIDDEAYLVNIG